MIEFRGVSKWYHTPHGRKVVLDGLDLTLPPGSDGKHLPMIVNPHGGPIGPRNNWGLTVPTCSGWHDVSASRRRINRSGRARHQYRAGRSATYSPLLAMIAMPSSDSASGISPKNRNPKSTAHANCV